MSAVERGMESFKKGGSIFLASLAFEADAMGKSVLGYDFVEVKFGSYEYDLGWDLSLDDAEINVVPIPAAVWLLGTGLVGLVGLKRKIIGGKQDS